MRPLADELYRLTGVTALDAGHPDPMLVMKKRISYDLWDRVMFGLYDPIDTMVWGQVWGTIMDEVWESFSPC